MNGTLVEPDPKNIADSTVRLKTALKALSKDSKTFLGKEVDLSLPLEDLAQAILRKSAKKEFRDMMDTPDLDEMRKASINLRTNIAGEDEAPRNGSERKFMREVMGDVRDNLRSRGIDITMADAQAVLWYPEKILYSSFKK